ncbi:MAG: hypothetical protein EXS05_24410 [Planctomycetaceae bacterium]|nr:hypothetical protein [Planctomycetaceae bacterium]
MRGPRERYGAGKAVALLATCFVVVGGAFTCVVISLSAGEESRRPLWLAAAFFAGIVALLWLLRDRKPENRFAVRWDWLARRRRRKIEYRLSHRPRGDSQPAVPNAPPTAESVRQLTGGINTWVPAPAAKPPPKSQA